MTYQNMCISVTPGDEFNEVKNKLLEQGYFHYPSAESNLYKTNTGAIYTTDDGDMLEYHDPMIEYKEYIKYTAQEFLAGFDDQVAVRVETLEQWHAVLDVAFLEGYTWSNGGTRYHEEYAYGSFTFSKRTLYFYKSDMRIAWGTTDESYSMSYDSFMATRPTKDDLQYSDKGDDVVDHPAHYNEYEGFEVINVIEQVTPKYDERVGYHIGNALKYIMRAPFKGKTVEDLEKAQWYLNRAISLMKEDK